MEIHDYTFFYIVIGYAWGVFCLIMTEKQLEKKVTFLKGLGWLFINATIWPISIVLAIAVKITGRKYPIG